MITRWWLWYQPSTKFAIIKYLSYFVQALTGIGCPFISCVPTKVRRLYKNCKHWNNYFSSRWVRSLIRLLSWNCPWFWCLLYEHSNCWIIASLPGESELVWRRGKRLGNSPTGNVQPTWTCPWTAGNDNDNWLLIVVIWLMMLPCLTLLDSSLDSW